MEGLRVFITFRIRKINNIIYRKSSLKMPQTLHYPPKEVYYEKYDFSNPQVFEQLEDKAIDGQLDYSSFPPPEYKYFSRLAKVGYNNRHKGWDINICLEWQDKLRTEYKRDRNDADEYRMLSQRIMDNVKKSADFVRKMYQSQTNEQTIINALQALECLTNENGLTKRIIEKLKENKEND